MGRNVLILVIETGQNADQHDVISLSTFYDAIKFYFQTIFKFRLAGYERYLNEINSKFLNMFYRKLDRFKFRTFLIEYYDMINYGPENVCAPSCDQDTCITALQSQLS